MRKPPGGKEQILRGWWRKRSTELCVPGPTGVWGGPEAYTGALALSLGWAQEEWVSKGGVLCVWFASFVCRYELSLMNSEATSSFWLVSFFRQLSHLCVARSSHLRVRLTVRSC